MEEKDESDLERFCQAVSPNDEPCDSPATVHCAKCGRWFCDAHAEDKEWHPCMLPPGDEGAEASSKCSRRGAGKITDLHAPCKRLTGKSAAAAAAGLAAPAQN